MVRPSLVTRRHRGSRLLERTWRLAALLSLTAGCGPVASFTARGAACPSHPEECEVQVITERPAQDYQVVGTLDIEAFSVRSIPDDEASLLALVTPEVCRAGGDAVIPAATGDGRYVVATVVKWVEPGTTEPVCVEEEEEEEEDEEADDESDCEGTDPC